MTLPPGTRLGPFEVRQSIGSGGMGEVYRARDPRLGREVALKVLPEAVSTEPARLQRFEEEARAAARLTHPNLLTIFEVGSHNGRPYIASELLDGETLRSRLDGGPLPRDKAVRCAVEIAEGLAAAHERGIIHRDLKPANIFFTRDGRVKILDFGLAKLTQPPEWDETEGPTPPDALTQSTGLEVRGTPGYVSPEQLQGEAADARSDIFGLGAVLFEMLTGERAFSGRTPIETLGAVLHEDPFEKRVAARIPSGLAALVRRCLEKSPAERFQSARDLAFALQAAGGRAAPLRRPARAVALVALVALLAAGVWALRPRGRTKAGATTVEIAVLPIAAPAGDAELQLVALSILDLLAQRVAALPGLRLRNPDFLATPTPVDERDAQLRALARPDVRVNAIRGELRRASSEDRGRLSLELVELLPEGDIRASPLGEYEIPFLASATDLRAFTNVREAVVGQVVRLLAPALSLKAGAAPSPRQPEAYRLYLLAMRDLRAVTCGGGASAMRDLRRSVELDPGFAPAWEELGWAYYTLVSSCVESGDNYRLALEAADRALALAPERVRASGLKAIIFAETSRAEAGYELLRSAAAKTPESLDLLLAQAYVLTYAGFLDDAAALSDKALGADPTRSTTLAWSTNAYLYRGDLERFLSLQLASDSPLFGYYRGYAAVLAGNRDAAKRSLAAAYREHPNDLFARLAQSLLETVQSRPERARLILGQLALQRETVGAGDGEITFKIALLLARARARDDALSQLSRAVEQGFFCPPCIETEPSLASLRDSTAYADTLRRARDRHRKFGERFGLPAS